MIGGTAVSRAYTGDFEAEDFAEDCASAIEESTRLMHYSKGDIQ